MHGIANTMTFGSRHEKVSQFYRSLPHRVPSPPSPVFFGSDAKRFHKKDPLTDRILAVFLADIFFLAGFVLLMSAASHFIGMQFWSC